MYGELTEQEQSYRFEVSLGFAASLSATSGKTWFIHLQSHLTMFHIYGHLILIAVTTAYKHYNLFLNIITFFPIFHFRSLLFLSLYIRST